MVPDMSNAHSRKGDFLPEDAERAMDKPAITGCAIEHYRRYAAGMRSDGYAVSRKQSLEYAQAFTAAGIPAAHIDGETPADEQQRLIGRLADGDIRVLFNVQLVDTGFDLSAQVGRDVPIECMIDMQPTRSLVKHQQKQGRALRRKPTKAVLLDHAGNIARFAKEFGAPGAGLPDFDYPWSLDGKQASRQQRDATDVAVRECPECYCAHRPAPRCPECGHVYPVTPREIEQRAGELVRIERAESAPEPEQKKGTAHWIAVGKARGVRNPFAYARMMAGEQ
jgi:superfamily II DNA or RNA helicase